MHTPHIRRRVIALGVAVVVVVTVTVDVLLYVGFRSRLLDNLSDVLEDRAELVRGAAEALDPPALAAQLRELGIRATITAADGSVYRSDPPSPSLGRNLPPGDRGGAVVSRHVELPNGGTAVVFARRAGVDDALRKLLALEALGLVVATVLATLLLLVVSRVTLRPLRQIAVSARRTAAGASGERLHPDRPDTELGQMALAYDDMLDALEKAVSHAREAQAASEKLRQRAREIVETATAAFVAMDSSGAIVDWTPHAERTFGWSAGEAIGRPLVDTIIPPAFRAAHEAGLKRYLATGEAAILGRPVEVSALHRDGAVFPVELTVWATDEGGEAIFNAFVQDITERRRGAEAIARLAAIVESAQEAIYTRGLDGIILTWNCGAERLYGYTAAEAIGRPFSLLLPPGDERAMDEILAVVRRGERVEQDETIRIGKGGRPIDVSLTVSPIFDAEGVVVGASSIARDITARKRAEERLARERNLLQAFVEGTPDRVYFKDSESRFIRVNRALAEDLGLGDPSDAIGKTDRDFFSQQHARKAREDEVRVM
ncbi:MAG: PAS domain S-box protein, partial [Actinomycetota bacterium]|nr:PAS domain S-box protein [Actinomycetota bacterium]